MYMYMYMYIYTPYVHPQYGPGTSKSPWSLTVSRASVRASTNLRIPRPGAQV